MHDPGIHLSHGLVYTPPYGFPIIIYRETDLFNSYIENHRCNGLLTPTNDEFLK